MIKMQISLTVYTVNRCLVVYKITITCFSFLYKANSFDFSNK